MWLVFCRVNSKLSAPAAAEAAAAATEGTSTTGEEAMEVDGNGAEDSAELEAALAMSMEVEDAGRVFILLIYFVHCISLWQEEMIG